MSLEEDDVLLMLLPELLILLPGLALLWVDIEGLAWPEAEAVPPMPEL